MVKPLRELLQKLFRHRAKPADLAFSRPLVLLESDDWGRVGVRDKQGFESLRSRGLRLGEHPYDLYALETATDVAVLAHLLAQHHDSGGRSPCMVMNFCTSNLNFKKMRARRFEQLELLALADGLPGRWSRPGLIESYRAGIRQGVFYPAVHGLTHFCSAAAENALAEDGERARLLRMLWEAETPYIYWRMPWIGYEYWNPEKPRAGFLSAERQDYLIQQACQEFSALFGTRPTSACAPGYRANGHTHRAWSKSGIRIVQNGTGSGLKAPHVDEFGLLNLYRTIDFEPSQKELEIEKYLQIAGSCFARGWPVIISSHSINFHSSLKDFRTATLVALDSLLTALEDRFPKLLYVHDEDLYAIVTEGVCPRIGERVEVSTSQQHWKPAGAHQGAL